MNGKKCKILRGQCSSRKEYQSRKKAAGAQALTNAAQCPTPVKLRKHTRQKAIKPTWPQTLDQHLQGRPIIVQRPVRALIWAMLESNLPDMNGQRRLSSNQLEMVVSTLRAPKHRLDFLALSY